MRSERKANLDDLRAILAESWAPVQVPDATNVVSKKLLSNRPTPKLVPEPTQDQEPKADPIDPPRPVKAITVLNAQPILADVVPVDSEIVSDRISILRTIVPPEPVTMTQLKRGSRVTENNLGQPRITVDILNGIGVVGEGKEVDSSNHLVEDMAKLVKPGQSVRDYVNEALARTNFPDSVKRTVNSLQKLSETARPVLRHLILQLEAEGIDVSTTETIRPQDRQEWLFQQGRSREGSVVTWTLTSNHREGNAMDLILNKDQSGMDPAYAKAHDIARTLGLIIYPKDDAGHFEFVGVESDMGEN